MQHLLFLVMKLVYLDGQIFHVNWRVNVIENGRGWLLTRESEVFFNHLSVWFWSHLSPHVTCASIAYWSSNSIELNIYKRDRCSRKWVYNTSREKKKKFHHKITWLIFMSTYVKIWKTFHDKILLPLKVLCSIILWTPVIFISPEMV